MAKSKKVVSKKVVGPVAPVEAPVVPASEPVQADGVPPTPASVPVPATDKRGRKGQAAEVVRRLAAILAADVVGYSRLMGRDENGTLERLREHRQQRLEPVLARQGGRLVKLTGDGALVEFPSAVRQRQHALGRQGRGEHQGRAHRPRGRGVPEAVHSRRVGQGVALRRLE
jgi:class 3 adenylate cyclase